MKTDRPVEEDLIRQVVSVDLLSKQSFVYIENILFSYLISQMSSAGRSRTCVCVRVCVFK